MSEHDPSADPELLDALREEDASHELHAVKARVFGRVTRTIASMGAGLDAPAAGAAPRVTAPVRSVPSLVAHPAWWAVGAFSIGAATGVTVYAGLRPEPPERVIFVDRIVEAPAPSPTVSAPTADTVVAPPEPSAAAPVRAGLRGLAAERALLDEARAALGTDDYAGALRAVRLHESRFAAGILIEEREALAIKTLAAAGRLDEARARAVVFGQRFPKSLFASSVAEALANP